MVCPECGMMIGLGPLDMRRVSPGERGSRAGAVALAWQVVILGLWRKGARS